MTHLLNCLVTALDLLALAGLSGLLTLRLVIAPLGITHTAEVTWGRTLLPALTLLTLSTLLILLLRSLAMSPADSVDVSRLLPMVLLHSHFGQVWLIRLLALGLLWGAWWLGRGGELTRTAALAMLLPLALLIYSRAAIGHAADQGDLTTQEWADMFHLLGAVIWVGSVLIFALPLHRDATDAVPGFAGMARRISRLAGVLMPLVLLTGLYNAYHRLTGLQALISSTYGGILLLKVGLVAVMIAIAAINRYRILPLLHAISAQSSNTDKGMLQGRFLLFLRLEAVVALAVLLLAAVLLHSAPPIQ